MPEEWIELTDLRVRSGKTFQKHIDGYSTNEFMWKGIAGAPLHYPDEFGDLQDIDTALVPSTRSITGFGNPAWEMVENEYEMFVLDELNSGVPLVRYEAKHTDYYIQFAAHNLEWSNDLDQIELIATPATTATELSQEWRASWPDTYGVGLSLHFDSGAGAMRKWLVMDGRLPDPPQFIIDGGNPVVQLNEILEFDKDLSVFVNGEEWNQRDDIATMQAVEFRSPDGKVQFVFPVASGYQEGLPEPTEEGDFEVGVLGETRLKKQGPNLYITMRFPWSWLEVAGYPVYLDATVDKQVGASGDDAYYDGTDLLITNQVTYLGKLQGKTRETFARFTGVTYEGTVSAGYQELYAHNNGTGTANLKVSCVDANDPDAPTTASEFLALVLTTANQDWDETFTIDTWEGADVSLVGPLQELADTYTMSNVAVIIVTKDDASSNNNYNQARQYDFGAGAQAPKLHIEYSAAVGQPTEVRTWGIPTGHGYAVGAGKWN